MEVSRLAAAVLMGPSLVAGMSQSLSEGVLFAMVGRIIVWLCTAASAGLAVWAIVLVVSPEAPPAGEPPFVIADPDRDVGAVPLGPLEVTFAITNPAARPRRVIGFAEG